MELSVCQVTGIFWQKLSFRLVVSYLARVENTDHKDLKGWIWSCIRLPVSGFLTLIVITFGLCNKAEKTRLWTFIIFMGFVLTSASRMYLTCLACFFRAITIMQLLLSRCSSNKVAYIPNAH